MFEIRRLKSANWGNLTENFGCYCAAETFTSKFSLKLLNIKLFPNKSIVQNNARVWLFILDKKIYCLNSKRAFQHKTSIKQTIP